MIGGPFSWGVTVTCRTSARRTQLQPFHDEFKPFDCFPRFYLLRTFQEKMFAELEDACLLPTQPVSDRDGIKMVPVLLC